MNLIRKIAVNFFSVYLVVLMVLPCTEAHASIKDTVTHHSHKDHTGDSHQDEVCTPFCVCGSCVVAVVLYPVLEITFLGPESTTTEVHNFYSSLKSDFHGTIWQPPQLV